MSKKTQFSQEEIEAAKKEILADLKENPPMRGRRRIPYVAYLRVQYEGAKRVPYLNRHVFRLEGTMAQKSLIEYYFAKAIDIVDWWFPDMADNDQVKSVMQRSNEFTTEAMHSTTTGASFRSLDAYCKFLRSAGQGRDVGEALSKAEAEKEALLKRVAELEAENSKKKGAKSGMPDKPAKGENKLAKEPFQPNA